MKNRFFKIRPVYLSSNNGKVNVFDTGSNTHISESLISIIAMREEDEYAQISLTGEDKLFFVRKERAIEILSQMEIGK